jgi:hypothetical protein
MPPPCHTPLPPICYDELILPMPLRLLLPFSCYHVCGKECVCAGAVQQQKRCSADMQICLRCRGKITIATLSAILVHHTITPRRSRPLTSPIPSSNRKDSERRCRRLQRTRQIRAGYTADARDGTSATRVGRRRCRQAPLQAIKIFLPTAQCAA